MTTIDIGDILREVIQEPGMIRRFFMASRPKPSPLRVQLRNATHEAHVRLNRHPLLRQLTRPSLTKPIYTHILQAYWRFYQEAEAHIRHSLAIGLADFDYTERYKTGWLKEDLSRFRLTPGATPLSPVTAKLAAPTNTAELIGMMYPLEGSTLGGTVISKHLANNLSLTRTNGARFFNGYGNETEQKWSLFREFSEHALTTKEERAQACNYSIYLFETLEAVLDVQQPPA